MGARRPISPTGSRHRPAGAAAGRLGTRNLALLLLACAAAACVLVALGVISQVRTGSDLAPASGSIVNDTGSPVAVGPCQASCTAMLARFQLAPGKSVRTGSAQSGERWLVLDGANHRLGCLTPGSGAARAEKLRVSQAQSC
jgi:hypothetical protein